MKGTRCGYVVVHLMPTEQAEWFLRWARDRSPDGSPGLSLETRDRLIESYSDTPEGRLRLAESYVRPSQLQMQDALKEGRRAARRVCRQLEDFLVCFPPDERFSEPLIRVRESLIELYAYLSPRYKRIGGRAVLANFREHYEGPRVSRYKREPVV
jgi:hypothetical protein